MSTFVILDKMSSFEHGIGLQPRHPSSSLSDGESVNHVPGHLSGMYPGFTEGGHNPEFERTAQCLRSIQRSADDEWTDGANAAYPGN